MCPYISIMLERIGVLNLSNSSFVGFLTPDFKKKKKALSDKWNSHDFWKWTPFNNSLFSTSLAYKIATNNYLEGRDYEKENAFKRLWSCYTSRRVQSIVWKVLHQRLLTKESLQRRAIIQPLDDVNCPFCGAKEESVSSFPTLRVCS